MVELLMVLRMSWKTENDHTLELLLFPVVIRMVLPVSASPNVMARLTLRFMDGLPPNPLTPLMIMFLFESVETSMTVIFVCKRPHVAPKSIAVPEAMKTRRAETAGTPGPTILSVSSKKAFVLNIRGPRLTNTCNNKGEGEYAALFAVVHRLILGGTAFTKAPRIIMLEFVKEPVAMSVPTRKP